MSPITDTKTLTQSRDINFQMDQCKKSQWIQMNGSVLFFLPVENQERHFELVEAHPISRDIQKQPLSLNQNVINCLEIPDWILIVRLLDRDSIQINLE